MEKKRILFICSLPRGKHEVRFTDEIGTIEELLLSGASRDEYDFAPKMSVKPLLLMRTIAGSSAQSAPFIVHFSMHGDKDKGLIFSDEKQQPAFQSKEYILDLFDTLVDEEWKVSCLVFSACHSKPFAEKLTDVVDVCIGIEGAIPDEAMIRFSHGFYAALFDNWDIKQSFKRGKSAVRAWIVENGFSVLENDGTKTMEDDGGPVYDERILLFQKA
jgi:hypothetical protein